MKEIAKLAGGHSGQDVDFDVENLPLGEYLMSALESLLKNFAKVRTYEA